MSPTNPPPSSTQQQFAALANLHTHYRQLLNTERAALHLERQLWEQERSVYLSRIAELEGSTPPVFKNPNPFSPPPTANPENLEDDDVAPPTAGGVEVEQDLAEGVAEGVAPEQNVALEDENPEDSNPSPEVPPPTGEQIRSHLSAAAAQSETSQPWQPPPPSLPEPAVLVADSAQQHGFPPPSISPPNPSPPRIITDPRLSISQHLPMISENRRASISLPPAAEEGEEEDDDDDCGSISSQEMAALLKEATRIVYPLSHSRPRGQSLADPSAGQRPLGGMRPGGRGPGLEGLPRFAGARDDEEEGPLKQEPVVELRLKKTSNFGFEFGDGGKWGAGFGGGGEGRWR
ncbi:hypothetical protein FPQ18DRAFT_421787 [Pyronema domesticum]|uniref:Uncharacterized protein n=1 Tax=Pyronema omphalodes (strain CBS 100304) TaxID=1076935 RepID=U4L985_PYROM|nr:hypothetical protein FPQ18DRAFT_421787 [Pyronema domesticum]CCX14977.1 Protein of unknown function [Pyronema omphalodes CBS 100304]